MVRSLILSSAAVLLTASAAFAAYDPAAEAREREITRRLNAEQMATAQLDRDAELAMDQMQPAPMAPVDDDDVEVRVPADRSVDNDIRAEMDDMTSTMPAETSPESYASSMTMDDDDTIASAEASEIAVSRGAGIELDEVVRPSETLPDIRVETSRGEAVGEIQSVILGPNGVPSSLVIEADHILGDEEPIQIDASQFVYDPDRNIVVTDLTTNEIQNMALAE